MSKRFLRGISMLVLCVLFGLLPVQAQQDTGAVTLTETTVTWQTIGYELDENYAVIPGSLDFSNVIEETFTAYVIENDYVQATIVPEYGGRILSLIDKTTGHEQLYQNPLGLPYGIGDGNFYYDWLMVYGGIFPTFPAPEHGKAWFLPWSFDIVTETSDEITIRMRFVDDVDIDSAPQRFNPVATGIEAEYYVTLLAGHRAIDTTLTLHNPTGDTISYEYWTCVTLAPGSEVGDTRTPASSEIIAPVNEIKMPPWWPLTNAQETATGAPDIYTFENLRILENWADMGIAYAYPTMDIDANFWGVINQDNQEGLIRIADNTVTPGLKIWTWGEESLDLDESLYAFDERRPYIELWAGVTPEFFNQTFLRADETVTINERYAITVGLTNVTHANQDALVNFYHDETDQVHFSSMNTQPERELRVVISADDTVIYEAITGAEPIMLPDEGASTLTFVLLDEDDTNILEGALEAP